jgi:hypothetical protein
MDFADQETALKMRFRNVNSDVRQFALTLTPFHNPVKEKLGELRKTKTRFPDFTDFKRKLQRFLDFFRNL